MAIDQCSTNFCPDRFRLSKFRPFLSAHLAHVFTGKFQNFVWTGLWPVRVFVKFLSAQGSVRSSCGGVSNLCTAHPKMQMTHFYLVCRFSSDVLYSSSVCVCLLLYILISRYSFNIYPCSYHHTHPCPVCAQDHLQRVDKRTALVTTLQTQLTPTLTYLNDRRDTIRCIVANLVGDDSDRGDALVDENEPIVPLQQLMDSVNDYGDPNWEPELVDAGPGGWFILRFFASPPSFYWNKVWLWSFVSLDSILVESFHRHSTLDISTCVYLA